jgi:hypothetical protein
MKSKLRLRLARPPKGKYGERVAYAEWHNS